MSKGGYLGGSSVVGFSGSFTGRKGQKLVQATDVDAHLTQKSARDAAREAVSGKRKKRRSSPKSERLAENEARKHYREAPTEVVVEHRSQGEIVEVRTVHRS